MDRLTELTDEQLLAEMEAQFGQIKNAIKRHNQRLHMNYVARRIRERRVTVEREERANGA